jgi:hypothetical protein
MINKFKPTNTPNGHWYAGLILLCVTCIFLIFTVCAANNEYDFMQTAARAKGVVISQYAGKHHVEISFTTASGELIKYPQNGHISYETGEVVTVLYDPKEPGMTAETDAFGAIWGDAIDLSIFAFGAFILSMLTIFFPKYIHISGPGVSK